MTKAMVKKSSNLIKLTETKEHGFRISSMAFVEHSGVTYKATNNLIKKHKTRLETFGYLPFEKDDKSKSGREIHALLNEDQAIFLLTLSKNTEQVVDFKHRLVTAFARLKRKQALIDEQHAKVVWHQGRDLGLYHHHDMTDSLKQYVDYARAQGSSNSKMYYMCISKLVNKTLSIADRDEVDESKLALLAVAEMICERVIVKGMAEVLPYKTIYIQMKQAMYQYNLLTEGEAA